MERAASLGTTNEPAGCSAGATRARGVERAARDAPHARERLAGEARERQKRHGFGGHQSAVAVFISQRPPVVQNGRRQTCCAKPRRASASATQEAARGGTHQAASRSAGAPRAHAWPPAFAGGAAWRRGRALRRGTATAAAWEGSGKWEGHASARLSRAMRCTVSTARGETAALGITGGCMTRRTAAHRRAVPFKRAQARPPEAAAKRHAPLHTRLGSTREHTAHA